MKLWQLVNSINAINELLSIKLPLKTAFKLKVFVKNIDDELKSYEEIRTNLIKELWEEVDGNIKVKEENINEFITKLNELLEQDTKTEVIELSIDELWEWNIDTKTLLQLDWLIK